MGYIKLSAVLCTCIIALIFADNKTCRKSTNFDRHPGTQLQDHVIKKMTTTDWGNCVIECGKTPGCLSINSHNTGNVINCELNKSNQYGRHANLIKTSLDWEYLEMVSSRHWSDACFQKDGWYRNRSSAYKFVNEKVSGLEARRRCQKMSADGNLVSFVDREEEKIVDQYLKGVFQGEVLWIGLNRSEEGTFVWLDGTKLNYINWYNGQPNNYHGNEYCAGKWHGKDGRWLDYRCSFELFPFACKVFCA